MVGIMARGGTVALLAAWLWASAVGLALAGPEGALVRLVDEPLPPYAQGPLGGLATGGLGLRFSQAIFGRLGHPVQIHLLPWNRALSMVRHGQADGIPLLMDNPERRAFMVFTVPVLESGERFYYCPQRLGEFSWRNWRDLRPYVIGLIDGYTYGQDFLTAQKGLGLKVEYAGSKMINFQKLAAGRIDLYLEDQGMARHFLAQHPELAAVVAESPRPVGVYTYHLGISRASPWAARVPELDRVIRDLRERNLLEPWGP